MKSILRIAIALLFVAVIFPFAADAQKKSDYTIDQYFNMLTESQLPILGKYKNRASFVKEVDYQNRYILLANDEWKGWGEMVVFDNKDGSHLIAVTQYDCTRKYPSYPYYNSPMCDGTVKFLTLKKGKLVEMTDVLPDLKKLMLYGFYEKKTGRLADGDYKLIFELPKERKDILIKLQGENVYSLVWNGKSFDGEYVK